MRIPSTAPVRADDALTRPVACFAAFVFLVIAASAWSGCRGEAQGSGLGQGVSLGSGSSDDSAESRVELRRLWAGSEFNFYASSPSSDGRYVTEIDWSTGDLAVRDLADGRLYRLTDKGDWTVSGDYALASTFSARGDKIAFVWWNTAAQKHELRTLRFDVDRTGTPRGSSPRVLYSNAAMQPYSIFGWAEDGWILATLRRPDRTNALAVVSAETGETRVLESFDWRQPGAARSPDGRNIAYDFPAGPDTPDRDIWILSEDGRKAALVDGPADDVVLGWERDGSALLFASRRSGRTSIHRLTITGGVAAGPAQSIGAQLPGHFEPLGATADAIYVGVAVESTRFHVASLGDRTAGGFASTEPFDDPYGGSIRAWDWSGDGSHIVHDARGARGSSEFRIVVRSRGGEPVRNFHLDGRADVVRWAPDGRSVFLYSWDRAGRPGLRVLDLASGDLRTIRQFDAEWQAMGGQFALSPDGKHLYYRLLDQGAAVRIPLRGSIIRLNLETGEERPFHAVRSGGSLAFSPDGRRLAFVDYEPDERRRVIRIIPADGGEARIIQVEGEIIEGLNWTPDGRNLVFLGGTADGSHDLLQVAVAGGEATRLADVPWLAYAEPRLHPDGRRIAFRAGRNLGEIWALDGIGSGATTASETEDSR